MSEFNKGSKSFYLASLVLPKDIRDAISYLYYICRTPDDIVDLGINEDISHFLTDKDIRDFFVREHIPFKYYEDLHKGFELDQSFAIFETRQDLLEYCYYVAGTVGAMMSYLFGFEDNKTIEYAKKMGLAMQLTNILRDVKQDIANGRCYFAMEDIQKHNVPLKDLQNSEFTPEVRNLMFEYICLANSYYIEAEEGIKYFNNWRIRLCVKLASKFYKGILRELEKRDFNPFIGRVYVNLPTKIIYLFRTVVA